MYCEFYRLRVDPFRLSPDHGFCLPHPSFVRAKAYLHFALQQQEGFVVVTGRPGTGKTTLVDELLAECGDDQYNFARLMSVQMDADDLLHMVGYAFAVPVEGLPKAAVLRALTERFRQSLNDGRRPVLIVDEAQGLSRAALEELRLLTNFTEAERPMLQIFLVGQDELRERLTDPALDQLNQRIVAACHMEPLRPRETVAYVLHRLRAAGWRHSPRLESEIFPALYRFSGGIPRRINRIFGRLLLHGFLEQKPALSLADIELVITELRSEHLGNVESNAIIDLRQFDDADLQALAESAILEDAETAAERPIGELLLQPPASEAVADDAPVQSVPARETAGPVTVGAPSGVAHEPIDLVEQAVRLRRQARRADRSPLWGLAAALLMGVAIGSLALYRASPAERELLMPGRLIELIGGDVARLPSVSRRPVASVETAEPASSPSHAELPRPPVRQPATTTPSGAPLAKAVDLSGAGLASAPPASGTPLAVVAYLLPGGE